MPLWVVLVFLVVCSPEKDWLEKYELDPVSLAFIFEILVVGLDISHQLIQGGCIALYPTHACTHACTRTHTCTRAHTREHTHTFGKQYHSSMMIKPLKDDAS